MIRAASGRSTRRLPCRSTGVVDLSARALHQYRAPADGAYARSAVVPVPFGETIRSVTLVGLAVPTAALLDDGEERG